GKRKVPDGAPTSFVKPRWRDHVVGPEGEIDRRYYELSALSELKNGLRSGDVWVPGSRRYRDFDDYLIPKEDFEGMLSNGGPPVAVDTDFASYLEGRKERLHEALTEVGRSVRRGELEGVSLQDGRLKTPAPRRTSPRAWTP
nr:Tn3 family transposase [Actinomycetota bacterium]